MILVTNQTMTFIRPTCLVVTNGGGMAPAWMLWKFSSETFQLPPLVAGRAIKTLSSESKSVVMAMRYVYFTYKTYGCFTKFKGFFSFALYRKRCWPVLWMCAWWENLGIEGNCSKQSVNDVRVKFQVFRHSTYLSVLTMCMDQSWISQDVNANN